jgi:predicted RecB family nuclease
MMALNEAPRRPERTRVTAGSPHRRASGSLPLSATELSGFSECAHHTFLNLAVARGERRRPGENEIERLLLERRGHAHEARILQHYQALGHDVVKLSPAPARDVEARARAAEATLAAMRAGAGLIYQATLVVGDWTGRPDFLIQVPGQTALGAYGYEVVDAKLARHAQARALIQLCVYTEQLGALLGSTPEHFWIAIGGGSATQSPEPLRLRSADYLAYHRRVRERFEAFIADTPNEPYPEPVEHCDICRWWKGCEDRRRADDHPSLVAGITRRQRDRLALAGVSTAAALAALEPAARIEGIDTAPLGRIREQARLQVAARASGVPSYELLFDADPGAGLERLPPPTPGDLFLDLEGDAFAFGTGLDYLFGWVELGEPMIGWSSRTEAGPPRYHARWARTPAEEKSAFVALMNRIKHGRLEFPNLHVYHFGHREADALKKLSCRHGIKEDEVDDLLRQHVLVDLHAVVRQSLRASVESYTLKQLEGLYGFERQADRRAAAEAMQLFGFFLETGDENLPLAEYLPRIERYNEEDCLSCFRLRDWLEARRDEYVAATGEPLARPQLQPDPEKKAKSERTAEASAAVEELREGLPELEAEDSAEQRARRVLAHLVGWHWREQKSAWWEYYRAKELPAAERFEDRAVLHGLSYQGVVDSVAKSHIHRYGFPVQEHSIRAKQDAEDPDTGKTANIVALGADYVDVKRGKTSKAEHPRSLVASGPVDTNLQEQNVLAIAKALARRRRPRDGADYPSARALLSREAPRCGQAPGQPLLGTGEDPVAGVVRMALQLSGSVLAVQGPPGAGKTYAAAKAIVALVRAGRRVGVTANSHQVIAHLLHQALKHAAAEGLEIAAHHLRDDKSDEKTEDKAEAPADEASEPPRFSVGKDYPAVLARLQSQSLQLVGGTSFAWSRAEYQGSVDVLIVDEAAQVALANVVALSPAAASLILFGDPAQLEQPQRGVHPPGAGVSALEHLLGEALTMPAELGVFLPKTRRLHPSVCDFTSKVFYEGRLSAEGDLSRQSVLGIEPFPRHGLCFLPVSHRGNTNSSDEEVAAVSRVVGSLLGRGARYVSASGEEKELGPRSLLVVAPYNAQVAALRRALPSDVRVGTVDKFQGQEAPIVIYSMTTSSAADAPRGLEFLYSLNRLNVATSRAQALVILVASPELATAHCKSPRQMQLVNALCSYLERATPIDVSALPGAGAL